VKETKEFINKICQILKIEKPNITINDDFFKNKTTLAVYSIKDDEILIRSNYKNKIDLFFSIAHECRHKWQDKHGLLPEQISQLPNSSEKVRAYNLSSEEIDANAFAVFVIQLFFNLRPLFNGLDTDIKNKIYEKAEEIKKLYTKL